MDWPYFLLLYFFWLWGLGVLLALLLAMWTVRQLRRYRLRLIRLFPRPLILLTPRPSGPGHPGSRPNILLPQWRRRRLIQLRQRRRELAILLGKSTPRQPGIAPENTTPKNV